MLQKIATVVCERGLLLYIYIIYNKKVKVATYIWLDMYIWLYTYIHLYIYRYHIYIYMIKRKFGKERKKINFKRARGCLFPGGSAG